MSWGAQNRSKDAKTPSVARALSRKPKLALCGIQPFLDQVVPKGRCRRQNYTSEYEVIDKTELKYETQRQSTVGDAETRAAKSAHSTKPRSNGTANIIMNQTCSLVPFGGSKDTHQMTSKATIAQPGWPVVIDTDSPSPTGTNDTATFMNACLTAKKNSFNQSPASIKDVNGFKYTTQRGDLKIELGGKSDVEFATALADAISEHGALHAADPHYIGNAVVTIWLIKAGYSLEHICPSTPRTPEVGDVEFGDPDESLGLSWVPY
jgi:hypothetical protein